MISFKKLLNQFRIELKREVKTILVVDDQPIQQLYAKAVLESFGIKVNLVSNGAEAIQKVQTQDYPLILMDLGLPDQKGQEIANSILCWQKAHNRPLSVIAALSAQLTRAEEQHCFKVGIMKTYKKPLTSTKVREILGFIDLREGALGMFSCIR